MRWALCLTVVFVGLGAARAYALTCDEPGVRGIPRDAPLYSQDADDEGGYSHGYGYDAEDSAGDTGGDAVFTYSGGNSGRTIPVDARPWFVMPCSDALDADFACALVTSEQSVPVTLDAGAEGGARCVDFSGGNDGWTIARFVPAEALRPDTEYTVDCSVAPIELSGAKVRTRASEAPSSGAPTLRAEVNVRRTDGCCYDEYIEAEVKDVDAAFFAESGYVEIELPSGEIILRTEPDEEAYISIPTVTGDVRFTPVSATGSRGATVVVAEEDRGGDIVYIPCTVTRGAGRFGAWLLLPLVYLLGPRRRARRRR